MLAIIPARSGSKGLSQKNIRIMNGKPLLAHSIIAAIQSKQFDRIVLSTDDERIAEIGKEYGAEVPFLRPKEFATDQALAVDTYIYTLDRLKKEDNYCTDSLAILQPTSPLRSVEDIIGAIKLFTKRNADSVITFTRNPHPPQWIKLIDANQQIYDYYENVELRNRQDFPNTYIPNGAVFIFSKKIIIQKKYYTNNSFGYLMPPERSIDIDSILNFEFAEFLMKKNA